MCLLSFSTALSRSSMASSASEDVFDLVLQLAQLVAVIRELRLEPLRFRNELS